MTDAATARRIARSLPEAEDLSTDSMLRFRVRGKQFAWTYLERDSATGSRSPRLDVLAVRCPREEKEAILASAPETFFSTPHYDGFPAILVRLANVDEAELRSLLIAAWRCQAPKGLASRLR